MSALFNPQTAWSDLLSRIRPVAPPAQAKQADGGALSPEELRERELSSRLTGPAATDELLDHIRSLKTASGGGTTLLLSGGGGAFTVQLAEYLRDVVVIHHEPIAVEAMKARVLGSKASIANHIANSDRDPRILRENVIRPGIDYRWAELPQTSFMAETFDKVIIEQGHEFGMVSAIAEAKRVLRKRGLIVLLGYLPLKVVSRKNSVNEKATSNIVNGALEHGFEHSLCPLVTSDERHLLNAYRCLDFPFDEIAMGNPNEDYRSRMFMQAHGIYSPWFGLLKPGPWCGN